MKPFLIRFNQWIELGNFDPYGLAIFRIVYGVYILATFPSLSWVAEYDPDVFSPPIGPFRLLSTYPSAAVLVTLEVLIVIAAFCVTVGLFSRVASVSLALLLISAFGISYSFGKIDHNILLLVAPLALSYSGWGANFSVDSLRRRSTQPPHWRVQVGMRTLAFMIGLAFMTAALPKLLSGWLDIESQATQGYLYVQYMAHGRVDFLAPIFLNLNFAPLWEVLDWITIAFEAAILVAVISWPWFKRAIAFAALFHLSVLLMMNIAFAANMLTYGAFVAWTGRSTRVPPSLLMIGIAAATGTVALTARLAVGPQLTQNVNVCIVIVGGVIAISFLMREAVRLILSTTRLGRVIRAT